MKKINVVINNESHVKTFHIRRFFVNDLVSKRNGIYDTGFLLHNGLFRIENMFQTKQGILDTVVLQDMVTKNNYLIDSPLFHGWVKCEL